MQYASLKKKKNLIEHLTCVTNNLNINQPNTKQNQQGQPEEVHSFHAQYYPAAPAVHQENVAFSLGCVYVQHVISIIQMEI